MTAQELIAKVLECEGWPSEIHALARIAQKAIEQRDRAIDGAYRDCDVTPQIKEANAELDAIAKGEE